MQMTKDSNFSPYTVRKSYKNDDKDAYLFRNMRLRSESNQSEIQKVPKNEDLNLVFSERTKKRVPRMQRLSTLLQYPMPISVHHSMDRSVVNHNRHHTSTENPDPYLLIASSALSQ